MGKTFSQNSDYFDYRFVKNDIMFMYLCINFVFTKNLLF